MKPALIATDLDGTFLGPNAKLHPGNLMAARRAIQEGVVFVIATGRPRRRLEAIRDLADANPMVISSNGAAVGPLQAESPIITHPIAPENILAFAESLPPELEVSFAVEYEHNGGWEPGYPTDELSNSMFNVHAPLPELLTHGPVLKVLARTPHADTDVFAPLVRSAAHGLMEATFSWYDICGTAELSALGVNKGAALSELLHQLGIDSADAVAFGDMHNDLEMLQLVGRGYIMARSHEYLLGRGFTQIGAHEDGAVGTQILRLLED